MRGRGIAAEHAAPVPVAEIGLTTRLLGRLMVAAFSGRNS